MGEEIYQKALEYAKKKHEGQFRIGGAPFIVHPIAVAEILRQDGKQVEYRVAAVFHDLGKISKDKAILNKPGKLTKEEFEIMKTHTVIGAEMLEQLGIYQNEPLVKIAHQICRWHHERYDGKGYPDGLVGDEIPISAQVVSVADVYDALASERVYKKAVPHEKVLEMILHGECGQFNPILIECLQEISSRIRSECYDEEQET